MLKGIRNIWDLRRGDFAAEKMCLGDRLFTQPQSWRQSCVISREVQHSGGKRWSFEGRQAGGAKAWLGMPFLTVGKKAWRLRKLRK